MLMKTDVKCSAISRDCYLSQTQFERIKILLVMTFELFTEPCVQLWRLHGESTGGKLLFQ